MLLDCIAVGIGGFIGSVFRYLVSLIPELHKGILPYQTLFVNILGALIIGVTSKYAGLHSEMNPQLLLFLKVGICGGFTTFSTFALESAGYISEGSLWSMLVYAAVSVILCIAGVYIGQSLIR